jgi:hypothetical protein
MGYCEHEGMNLSVEDKEDRWYFQDAHSYNAIGPSHESQAQDHAQVLCYTNDDVKELLDLDGLALEIQATSRRKGTQPS